MQYNHANREKWLDGWKSVLESQFGISPFCQVCGIELMWFAKDRTKSVYLDHKFGDEAIQEKPYSWMRGHAPNEKNAALLLSCDFGILCNQCNLHLPTKARLDWLERAYKYAEDAVQSRLHSVHNG